MNSELAYVAILRRVGAVLIIIGIVDVGVMIYCILQGIRYASSFSIFALIAGIFLMRGSLRGAALISWFAAFLLAGFLGLAFVWPVFVPPGLALAEIRVYPLRFLLSLTSFAALIGLLFWVLRRLRCEAVLAASARSATKIYSLRGSILAGAAILAITKFIAGLNRRAEGTKRAEQIAASKVGSGYKLHVRSLRIITTNKSRMVSGVVTAWNDHEIREIPVDWNEK